MINLIFMYREEKHIPSQKCDWHFKYRANYGTVKCKSCGVAYAANYNKSEIKSLLSNKRKWKLNSNNKKEPM